MMLLTLRYSNALGHAQFVVSDDVAEDFFAAMRACEEDPGLSDWISVVDEAQPLPPIEIPEGRRDTRHQYGHPGSQARVKLRALCHARATPMESVES